MNQYYISSWNEKLYTLYCSYKATLKAEKKPLKVFFSTADALREFITVRLVEKEKQVAETIHVNEMPLTDLVQFILLFVKSRLKNPAKIITYLNTKFSNFLGNKVYERKKVKQDISSEIVHTL